MSGAEIVLGVAGLLGPLLAPPLESAFRHLRKPHYNQHHAREELRGNFIDSWSVLHGSLSRLAPVLATLTHDDPERRKVLREMERATKGLKKINKGLLGCKPIKRALREQEKTEEIVSAVKRRICDAEGEEEGGERYDAGVNHGKIKDTLAPLIVGGKGRCLVSNKSSHITPSPPPPPPPPPPPFTPTTPTTPSSLTPTSSISLFPSPTPSPQKTKAPRALLLQDPSSSLHLQIITKTHHHSRRRHHRKREREHKSKAEDGGAEERYFEDQRYDTSLKTRDRDGREKGEGRGGGRHFHHHHHYCATLGGGGEAGCSRVLLAGG